MILRIIPEQMQAVEVIRLKGEESICAGLPRGDEAGA